MKHRFTVTRSESGRALADWLRARLKRVMPEVLRLVRHRQIRIDGQLCTEPARRVRPGQQVDVLPAPAPRRPPSGASRNTAATARERSVPRPVIRFADAAIVVVDKPAGLTTMRHKEEVREFGKRARRFLPATLAHLLPELLAAKPSGRPGAVRAVHRIDKETSGLVVFARNVEAERELGRQFRAHATDRVYLTLVRGKAKPGRIESYLIRDRGDGRRGSTSKPGEGQRAVTHVRVAEELGDYTLVECRLETGRTHQVRIHLGEAGTPLCGDHVYDRPPHGAPWPDGSGAPRVLLHAARLGFEHPATGKPMAWSSPLPKDMADVLQRLRKHARDEPPG
jgi:23S rRNA pseudouridine1911/1915/1917 synthase